MITREEAKRVLRTRIMDTEWKPPFLFRTLGDNDLDMEWALGRYHEEEEGIFQRFIEDKVFSPVEARNIALEITNDLYVPIEVFDSEYNSLGLYMCGSEIEYLDF